MGDTLAAVSLFGGDFCDFFYGALQLALKCIGYSGV